MSNPAQSLQMDVGVVEWSKQQAAMQGSSSGADMSEGEMTHFAA